MAGRSDAYYNEQARLYNEDTAKAEAYVKALAGQVAATWGIKNLPRIDVYRSQPGGLGGEYSASQNRASIFGSMRPDVADTVAHELFHAKQAEVGHPDYENWMNQLNPMYRKEQPVAEGALDYAQGLPSVNKMQGRYDNERELQADIAADQWVRANLPNVPQPQHELIQQVLQRDNGSMLGADVTDNEARPAIAPGLLQAIELEKSKHLPSIKQPPLWYTIASILRGH